MLQLCIDKEYYPSEVGAIPSNVFLINIYIIGGRMKRIISLLLIIVLVAGCSQTKEVESNESSNETVEKEVVEETTEDVDKEEEKTDSEVEEAEEVESPVKTLEYIDYDFRTLATSQDQLIGACVEPAYLDEEDYANTLKKYFSVITPENRMKWSFIHPEKDVYAFEEADKIVDFAMENDMKVRGHALLWHIQNPEWLENEEWTREELIDILEDHIKTVVGHYKGKVYAWDVVNEVVENNSYRDSFWYKTIGPEYIEMAFRFAHEADPDALLFINDYQVEEENLKSDFYYEIVTGLIENDAPIHGVGFQFHIDMNSPFEMKSVYSNMKRFSEIGLLIDFTEIDVRMEGEPTEAKLAMQGKIYESLMDVALRMDNIQSYTLWGFTDKYSWIPGFFSGQGHGLMFDDEYNPKEAFYMVGRSLTEGSSELPYEKMLDMSNRLSAKAMIAKNADTIPNIDGLDDEGEWDKAIIYKLAYNQINMFDQRTPENTADATGLFGLLYKNGYLYGIVYRTDDRKESSYGESYKNDNLEVFIQYNSYFNQLRTLVNKGFESNPARESLAVWNEEGTILEFMISMPEEDLTGLTMGFNMALSDSDNNTDGRKYQLYPFAGSNNSYMGRDMGLVWFEGDTPRPVSFEKVIPALQIHSTVILPDLDGTNTAYEWMESTSYPFGYDLVDERYKASPVGKDDIYGDFKIGHSGTQIYGYAKRADDITIIDEDPMLSDSVHFNFNFDGYPIDVISIVNDSREYEEMGVSYKTVWNDEGTEFEFLIDFTGADAEIRDQLLALLNENSIIPVNIMLYDVDEEGVINYVLSPFNGDYSEEVQYRGEMEIK